MWIPGVLSWAPSHHARHKTHRHMLFRVCVVVVSSMTSRSVAAAAASSLMRFSPSPSCRGDVANPWLESAFITHFGCVSRHLFVCFPQCIVIACVSRRVSSLLVFLLGFSRVSSLLVFPAESRHCFVFQQSLVTACVSRRVSSLLCVSVEYRHCLCFRVLLRPAQHTHAVFARMSDHGPPNPQFLSTSITKTDGSCSSSSDWRCTTARKAMCALVQDTSARSLFGLYVPTCTNGARQVRVACAKPQTSREVDQDPEGGLTRQCNTRPSFFIICCLWESLSQDDLPQVLLVSSVKLQGTHLVEFPLRVGIGARCVRAEGSRSLA